MKTMLLNHAQIIDKIVHYKRNERWDIIPCKEQAKYNNSYAKIIVTEDDKLEAYIVYSCSPIDDISSYIRLSADSYEVIDNVVVIRLNEFQILSTVIDDIQDYNDEIKENNPGCRAHADIINRNPVLIEVSFGCNDEF